MCREMGIVFEALGSSYNFTLFGIMYPAGSLDRVSKFYQLKLYCEIRS